MEINSDKRFMLNEEVPACYRDLRGRYWIRTSDPYNVNVVL